MRKSRNDKVRESAIAFAEHLSEAAGHVLSGRSFAATQMRKAAKLIRDLALAWGEMEHPTGMANRKKRRKRKVSNGDGRASRGRPAHRY
jgi:hypothetical protein